MKKRGENIHIWRTREILDHFLTHHNEPRIYLGESIKKYKNISKILENMVFKKYNDIDIIVPDDKNLKDLLVVDKRITDLYKFKPKSIWA